MELVVSVEAWACDVVDDNIVVAVSVPESELVDIADEEGDEAEVGRTAVLLACTVLPGEVVDVETEKGKY